MSSFLTKFTISFLAVFFPSLIIILLPFSLTYNSSKLVPGIIVLLVTAVFSTIITGILLRKSDGGSFSPLKTSLSLVGIFGIIPAISFVPLIIIKGDGSFYKIIAIIAWLFAVSFPVYVILRIKNSKKSYIID